MRVPGAPGPPLERKKDHGNASPGDLRTHVTALARRRRRGPQPDGAHQFWLAAIGRPARDGARLRADCTLARWFPDLPAFSVRLFLLSQLHRIQHLPATRVCGAGELPEDAERYAQLLAFYAAHPVLRRPECAVGHGRRAWRCP